MKPSPTYRPNKIYVVEDEICEECGGDLIATPRFEAGFCPTTGCPNVPPPDWIVDALDEVAFQPGRRVVAWDARSVGYDGCLYLKDVPGTADGTYVEGNLIVPTEKLHKHALNNC